MSVGPSHPEAEKVDAIKRGLQATLAARTQHQTEIVVSLPSIGATYEFRDGRLVRDGVVLPVRQR